MILYLRVTKDDTVMYLRVLYLRVTKDDMYWKVLHLRDIKDDTVFEFTKMILYLTVST